VLSIDEVKRELPTVKIRYSGQIWNAKVTGRLNQFASVSPHTRSRGKLVEVIMGPIYQFSWESVARAVNSDGVLNVD
jgi:hypothetical protein